jgi:hypothetical protein
MARAISARRSRDIFGSVGSAGARFQRVELHRVRLGLGTQPEPLATRSGLAPSYSAPRVTIAWIVYGMRA